jgi:hypothetical protein
MDTATERECGVSTALYNCQNCGNPFRGRTAERKRGSALYCSRSCKAIEQARRTRYATPGRGRDGEMTQQEAKTLRERLEAHSMPEPNSGCVLWIGAACRLGYGSMGWGGRTRKAHRMAWILAHGAISSDLFVCHKCDVPACINPDHLFLGTHRENMADRDAKCRNPRGEEIGNSKISAATAAFIRQDKRTHSVIAKEFGLSQSAVSRIKSRDIWKYVP